MNKHISKAVSMILFVTMLLSTFTFAALPSSAAPKRLKTDNGYLFIEAEDLDYGNFYVESNKNQFYSGNYAIYPLIDNRIEPAITDNPHLDLTFTADVTSTYTLWCRSTAHQDGGFANSVWLSVGEEPYTYCRIGGFPECPQWEKLATIPVEKGKKGSLRIQSRQIVSINMDCFIITSDTSYIPTDEALGLKSAPTPTPTPTPPPFESNPVKLTGGFFMDEAEDMYYNEKDVKFAEFDGASGKGVLQPMREDKTQPDINRAPSLDLSFIPDRDGIYTIWMRCTTAGADHGNSVFLSQNGGTYGYLRLDSGAKDELGWTRVTTLKASANEEVWARIVTRQLWDIRFDKVIITDDPMFVPEGKGAQPTGKTQIRLPADTYPAPTVLPVANEHPRISLTPRDIETVRANFENEENIAAYNKWRELVDKETTGLLPTDRGFNVMETVLTEIEALAFDALMNNNAESAKEAYTAITNYYDTVDYAQDSFANRYRGHFIYTAAVVYDWCFDYLTPAEKEQLIYMSEVTALFLTDGYPPHVEGSITGHTGEYSILYDYLALGLATYDERPDIYNHVAGKILEQFVEPRNFWYQSHSHHQGNAYGATRALCEIACAWLFKRGTGADVFSADQQYFPYEWLYSRRPDGQVLRDGDDYWQQSSSGTYWNGWAATLSLVANYYKDPYLKRQAEKEDPGFESTGGAHGTYSPMIHLIYNDPTIEERDTSELPLSHWFAAPKGMMIARTGWNDGVKANDVLVSMETFEHYAANHMHLQNGHFQIYYKGYLTGDSGVYADGYGTGHYNNYNKIGVAHNILTIFDPDETFIDGHANDGGQNLNVGETTNMERWMDPANNYYAGTILDHEFGPDLVTPEYTYLKGDITDSYSEKVDEVLRSFLFMPTGDSEHPAVFFVMDKVNSTNPAFKKSFLLHSFEEPTVEGNRTIIERTEKEYNGRLVVDTLLPKPENTVIEKIGGEGKQFWVNGTDYTPLYAAYTKSTDQEGFGWGRLEISPVAESNTDYFLHAMSVSDAGGVVADLDSTLIEGNGIAGAVIADRVAIFNKEKAEIASDISFTIPGEGSFKVAVCGIKAGTWTVNGEKEVIVTTEGNIAYFDANAGDVTLTRTGDNAERNVAEPVLEKKEYIGVRHNNAYIYSDSPATIVNGRTLVPMRAIFEKLGCEIEWDGETSTVTGRRLNADGETYTVVKLTIDDATAYLNDSPITLDTPATLINSRTMVPVRFIAESLGATVKWDSVSQTVLITGGLVKPKGTLAPGYAKPVNITGEGSEEFIPTNAIDNDYETLWSAQGEVPITVEFDKEYTITNIEVYLNPNSNRSARFDVLYSTDGTNFTTIGSYNSNGLVADDWEVFTFQEPVKAKYIRYFAKGSDKSMWNGVKEMRFKYQE